MTRALVAMSLLLAGCPKKLPASTPMVDALAGTWHDEGGTELIFQRRGDDLHVASIVDSDGERFELRREALGPGGFSFTYFVPSTSYTVDIVVVSVDGDVAHTMWSNDAGATGTEDMFRQR